MYFFSSQIDSAPWRASRDFITHKGLNKITKTTPASIPEVNSEYKNDASRLMPLLVINEHYLHDRACEDVPSSFVCDLYLIHRSKSILPTSLTKRSGKELRLDKSPGILRLEQYFGNLVLMILEYMNLLWQKLTLLMNVNSYKTTLDNHRWLAFWFWLVPVGRERLNIIKFVFIQMMID